MITDLQNVNSLDNPVNKKRTLSVSFFVVMIDCQIATIYSQFYLFVEVVRPSIIFLGSVTVFSLSVMDA
jgi:hypothetical protein